ncbi:hypothetical protein GUJ93_ZPchr0009g2117 [Zizania palustris]|uniref:Uncharacterized protein n=1 Tax=Zizania palustris TaxID=103762 RepID=A0A8J5RK85_ZIZPA|nr:hypothetical protein GUJ93_ZPchr0009g2117 [Zizania palustris]
MRSSSPSPLQSPPPIDPLSLLPLRHQSRHHVPPRYQRQALIQPYPTMDLSPRTQPPLQSSWRPHEQRRCDAMAGGERWRLEGFGEK